MADIDHLTVGPEECIGIFSPFELDCYLDTKTARVDSNDMDLFPFAMTEHVDHDPYGMMTKRAIKEALKNATANVRHGRVRGRFRKEYLAYLASRIKVESLF
ncbi:hypothetical protein XPA_006972 [Xanthoria parietina]